MSSIASRLILQKFCERCILLLIAWSMHAHNLKMTMKSNSNIFKIDNSVGSAPTNSMLSTSEVPLLTFGVIGDPQYVDADDGSNFDGSKIRRYRQSLKILSEACEFFTAQATVCNIILGDCLDGKAGSLRIQDRCLQEVFDLTVDKSDDKWHFVLGNHEYYCFDRESILEKMIPVSQRTHCSPSKLYYDFSPLPGFRFIVLDGYEVSIIGGSSTHHKEYAEALLREKNHNYANGSNQWFLNMSTENFRYCPYNGAISSSQLDWLCRTLQESLNSGEKCIVFCHEPIYVHCSHSNNLLWNCEEVLSLLQSYPNVIAFIAGHDHSGGFATDKSGIHHIIPPAPVECAEGEVAFGSFRVFSDRMDMLWAGKTPTKTAWPLSLPLRNGFVGN